MISLRSIILANLTRSLRSLVRLTRTGGKGTPRRKVVKKSQAASQGDDRKLQAALKKLNVTSVAGVEEVNMFKDDGNVLHFASPRGASFSSSFLPSLPSLTSFFGIDGLFEMNGMCWTEWILNTVNGGRTDHRIGRIGRGPLAVGIWPLSPGLRPDPTGGHHASEMDIRWRSWGGAGLESIVRPIDVSIHPPICSPLLLHPSVSALYIYNPRCARRVPMPHSPRCAPFIPLLPPPSSLCSSLSRCAPPSLRSVRR